MNLDKQYGKCEISLKLCLLFHSCFQTVFTNNTILLSFIPLLSYNYSTIPVPSYPGLFPAVPVMRVYSPLHKFPAISFSLFLVYLCLVCPISIMDSKNSTPHSVVLFLHSKFLLASFGWLLLTQNLCGQLTRRFDRGTILPPEDFTKEVDELLILGISIWIVNLVAYRFLCCSLQEYKRVPNLFSLIRLPRKSLALDREGLLVLEPSLEPH